MSHAPDISIGLPFRDAAETLPGRPDSIAAQTCELYEVLAIAMDRRTI